MLGPEHAATAAAHGWTRRDISSYLFQTARLPASRFRANFDVAGMGAVDARASPATSCCR